MLNTLGGSLDILDYPQHGKSSLVQTNGNSRVWDRLPQEFHVGRYHSLYAKELPSCLDVNAISEDGIVMGVEHKTLPITAVQFHPESIATLRGEVGLKLIENVVSQLNDL